MLKRKGWPAPLMTTPWGAYMEFEPSLVGWTIFEPGVWEPQQTALIAGLLHCRVAMVLNVGANTGYYALLSRLRDRPVWPRPRLRNAAGNGRDFLSTQHDGGTAWSRRFPLLKRLVGRRREKLSSQVVVIPAEQGCPSLKPFNRVSH